MTSHRANSGLAVLEKHGKEYMREIGRRGGLVGHGGRPRSVTLQAFTTRLVEGNKKKECATNIASLVALRAAWNRKRKEMELGI